MASLRGIYSATATECERLLNLGGEGRGKAKALLLEALATGNADPLTQRLAAEVFSVKKGRAATGLFRWFDIGEHNASLRDEGMPHERRIELLAAHYLRSTAHIEKCITQYEAGRHAARAAENEPE